MKKIKLLLTSLLAAIMLLAMFSCGGGEENNDDKNPPASDDKTITGISFADATFTYNGSEQSIAISGTLPEGVSVSYTGASATDAGEYTAVATLGGEGYKTLTLTATLKINKADISGITAEATQSVTADGNSHKPAYSGTLPTGVTVKYIFDGDESANGVSDAGTYAAKIVFEGKNYNTLTLNVSYTVKTPTTPEIPEDKEITGVSFNGATFTYDGREKALSVTGNLPAGVTPTYTNNKGTDAGTYNASVTLSGKGYKTLTLNATLTIEKADIDGISFDETQKVKHDGAYHKPTYSGNLPSGVSVKYYFDGNESENGACDIGTYAVKIVFDGKNYNTLTIDITYKITRPIDYANLANKVIGAFGSVPNMWEFLPESFAKENRVTSFKAPIDYSSFVNVSAIPTNGMGKQLNMVYGLFSKMDTASNYINTVYGSMNIIKSLYTAFLDEEPEDYQSFTASAGAFNFTITLDGDEYKLSASFTSVSITLFSNVDTESYGAIVRLSDTNVLKYTVEDGKVRLALNVLNASSTLIEFTKDSSDNTVAKIYEYLTVGGLDVVSSSAMLYVGDTYTTIIGTKGDFIVGSDGRNCEIYDNSTGLLVGTEVKESTSLYSFNTYWFPLCKLNGVTSIKKTDEENKENKNPDTVFINASEDALVTVKFGGGLFDNIIKKNSRAFDIEFKKMYFFNYDEATGEYSSIELEIPMLFVQEEKYSSFENDFKSANNITVSLNVKAADLGAISYAYDSILPIYNEVKEAVSREDIIEYCTGVRPEE